MMFYLPADNCSHGKILREGVEAGKASGVLGTYPFYITHSISQASHRTNHHSREKGRITCAWKQPGHTLQMCRYRESKPSLLSNSHRHYASPTCHEFPIYFVSSITIMCLVCIRILVKTSRISIVFKEILV